MTETTDKKQPDNFPKKSYPSSLIAIAGVLGILLIVSIVFFFNQKGKMVEMETILTQEKDSLANELRNMAHAYDTMRTNNDTLNAGLERERERIVRLLQINASNAQLIRTYRSEISTMREIMKSYIVQIDSLNSRNQILVAENTEIRQQMRQIRTTNTELSRAREQLADQVTTASVIQARDIQAVTLNKNRKETNRLGLLNNIRVCFTLRENPIARAGEKEVYMRLLRPDSLVITTSPNNVFTYNRTPLIYSAKRAVDYINQDIEMCIFMDNTGDFIVGTYSVELYLENNIIGRTTFIIPRR
jgi:FtsZ-binding cell division protein ZapB